MTERYKKLLKLSSSILKVWRTRLSTARNWLAGEQLRGGGDIIWGKNAGATTFSFAARQKPNTNHFWSSVSKNANGEHELGRQRLRRLANRQREGQTKHVRCRRCFWKDVLDCRRYATVHTLNWQFEDILDEPEGFIKCAELLKENGAKMVIVIATHAVLGQAVNDEALRKINNSKIDRIIVSNSIPMEESGKVSFWRRSSIFKMFR